MRRTGRLLVVALLGAGAASVPTAAAQAAPPSCDSDVADSAFIEALPWAQRMYDPDDKLWPFSVGAGVTVAVLDSGVDAAHLQLAGRVLPGTSLVPETPPEGSIDCVPFGTAVASIIAAQPFSGVGFYGLAPAAQILPVRVSDGIHTNPEDDPLPVGVLAQGIDYAVDSGADVLAISAVDYRPDQALEDAVSRAVAAGVIVVAGAGDGHDEGRDGLRLTPFIPYPAAYDGVIGVGSVGSDGTRSQTSQIGPYVDLVAPGLDVVAAAFGGHDSYNGTGIAVGFVAATAALMLGQPGSDLRGLSGPELVEAVTGRLYGTAQGTVGGTPSFAYGNGLVDPYRAMTEAPGGVPTAMPGRQVPPPDRAALALAAERAAAKDSAVQNALLLGGVAIATFAAAFFIPRADRRRWRPGRERELLRGKEDERPEHLPGDLLFQPSTPAKNRKDADAGPRPSRETFPDSPSETYPDSPRQPQGVPMAGAPRP